MHVVVPGGRGFKSPRQLQCFFQTLFAVDVCVGLALLC